MPETRPVPEGSSFAYDVAVASLEEQRKRTDALDSKAGVLLAAGGIIAGLVFGGESSLRSAPLVVPVLLTAFIAATITSALAAFANRRYETAPGPVAVTRMMIREESWLRWRFLGSLLEAIDANERKLAWKAKAVTFAQIMLLAAVLNLSGYFLYTVIDG